MRRILTFFAGIMFLLITACGNKSQTLTPITDDDGDFDYTVNNLRDTSMERTDEVRYLILVEKTSGLAEKVILSAEDVPAGMEVFFEPVNGVDASFNTTVVIRTLRVKEGDYKINIKGASPTAGIQNNYINIAVLPYSNAATGLKGSFTEKGSCDQQGSTTEDVNIVVDESVNNRIILRGLFSGVMSNEIHADLNPSNKTLIIPSQERNELIFSGEGTYDDDKLVINYTVKGTTVNESCTSTLTRK